MTLSFTSLPPGVRNEIYGYLFVRTENNSCITPCRYSKFDCGDWDNEMVHDYSEVLPFLRTCKQVNSEATAMLYGHHAFYFSERRVEDEKYCKLWEYPSLNCRSHHIYSDFELMLSWLKKIGCQNRSHIRQLILEFENFNTTYSRIAGTFAVANQWTLKAFARCSRSLSSFSTRRVS